MKKILFLVVVTTSLLSFGRPGPMPHSGHHRGPAPQIHRGPTPRPAPQIHRGPALKPAPRPHHSHHHGSAWGRGGRNFWPGFVGGVIGSTIVSSPVVMVTPPPPPPGPYARQVWIEAHYETQIVNGIYTQVWVPGRWVIVR